MSKARAFLAGVLLLSATSASCLASVITVPSGLAAGTQYRLVFVTDGERDATDDTIDPYNTFVTTEANLSAELSALSTNWRVIGSTFGDNVDARDNTLTFPGTDGAGIAIYQLSGLKVADNYADLWDGSIDNPINVTQSGLTKANGTLVWTGTNSDGKQHGSGTLGSDPPATGVATKIDDDWITNSAFLTPKKDLLSLYAISGVLTVSGSGSGSGTAAIPEPGGFAFCGVLCCLIIGRQILCWRYRTSRNDCAKGS